MITAVEIDTKAWERFNKAFEQYIIDSPKGAIEEFKEQLRLAVKVGINATPPRNVSQGRKRVKADLLSVFEPHSESYLVWLADKFGEHIKNLELKNKDGVPYTIDNWVVNRYGDYGSMSQFHQERRGRNGRVYSRIRQKMAVPKAKFNQYLKRIYKRVGEARGGWVLSFLKLGGGNLPGWYSQQIFRRPEIAVYRERLSKESAVIRIANLSTWATENPVDAARIKAIMLTNRAHQMIQHLIRYHKGETKRLGEVIR